MYITKLTKVAKLGEYDETYGQSYWCDTESESLPVKFNSLNQDFKEGDVIGAEEKTMKKSLKGTEYWQYKKVKALENDAGSVLSPDNPPEATNYHSSGPSGFQAPLNAPQSNETNLLLQSILNLTKQANAKLDKLLNLGEPDIEPLPNEPLGGIELE